MTFSLVKVLFKWIEGPSRNVITLVGSEAEIISNIGDLRKKYLIRCQIASSKNTHCAVSEKGFCSFRLLSLKRPNCGSYVPAYNWDHPAPGIRGHHQV